MRRPWILVVSLAAALVLGGCGSSSDPGSAGTAAGEDSSSSAPGAVLTTWDSPFGPVVVDADGRAVYVFDKDSAGASACSGQCLDNWPPVTADSASPPVDGVTGEVGTLTRDDGTTQVTLGGLPLYRFAGDQESGDVNGQGVQGVWWLVAPDGTKVTATAAPAVPGY